MGTDTEPGRPSSECYDAVIFDLGGVVLPSPFDAWANYEHDLGLAVGTIRGVVAASGGDGAWAQHERGELAFEEFVAAFEAECLAAGAPEVSALEVMNRLASGSSPRPEMLAAISVIRGAGLKTAALTNNWAAPALNVGGVEGHDDRPVVELARWFDVIVESAVEGIRKPDPLIYEIVCERIAVEPSRAVFLDDLGVNLKPARAMGMTTIKVTQPAAALVELGNVLGLSLTSTISPAR